MSRPPAAVRRPPRLALAGLALLAACGSGGAGDADAPAPLDVDEIADRGPDGAEDEASGADVAGDGEDRPEGALDAAGEEGSDDGGATGCLGEYPDHTLGLLAVRPGASEGYTLLAPLRYATAYLIDACGRQVHSWTGEYLPGNVVRLVPDGRLLWTGFGGAAENPVFNASGGAGGHLQLVEWDGTVSWNYTYSDAQHLQHHDAIQLPSGNVLFVAWERKTRAEAEAAGRDPALVTDVGLWPDHLVEVAPEGPTGGRVVWEWHVWDHLIQDFDPALPDYGVAAEHPERVDLNFASSGQADWLHSNALAYRADLDQVLLSVHGFNEIWVLDHGTTTAEAAGHDGGRYGRGGDLLYRWGNPRAYRAGTAAHQQLFGQHDAHWIEAGLPGAGRMLVFNNGVGRRFSSVDELVPPLGDDGRYPLLPGSAWGPARAAWSYVAPVPGEFFSLSISGSQRLPGGTTLICEGGSGHLFEVTPAGDIVWEYRSPVTGRGPLHQGEVIPGTGPSGQANGLFRAYRYFADHPGLAGRELTPGEVVELPRL